MKKVNAFTLGELLVVMVIATIVVSMAFVTLSMVKKQVFSIQKNFTDKQEVNLLERVLWQDFNSYGIANLKDANSFYFTNGVEAIDYQIFNNFVLRGKDSIFVTVQNKAMFLDGEEVNNGVFDAMKLETKEFYKRSIFVYLEKDASFYLNE
ncbi:prepilin-type N-terminal cleavage/methylation domain-containing protein [Tenacibaculum amylolyticum]|uniref:prepilin-type N-terminal cleavage/methylation domain-containing protein n=1 Tax=Tenacibaculum amylolyticum TaxID=104269 RepID=UPI0038959F5D